jgi:hypothetical protein
VRGCYATKCQYRNPSQEAYEEAGLVGSITRKRPVGTYHCEKQFAAGGLLCEVRAFLFHVDQQLDDWPEKDDRETKSAISARSLSGTCRRAQDPINTPSRLREPPRNVSTTLR